MLILRRVYDCIILWNAPIFLCTPCVILCTLVPVDDEHTLLYLRFYQKFMRLPVLGKLIAQMSMPSNVYIAHEDRRVVITQQPKASGLKIGEILIQGDLPIIEYRKKRAALQSQGQPS